MNESLTPGISRRCFLGTGLAGIAAASSMWASQMAPRPNIIYVFSDEHRRQSLSFTEMPEIMSPQMARMASEGVDFTHCLSSYPVCSPHRAMLLSGRWPCHTGVVDNGLPLSPDETTVADAFRAVGYRTAYIGKWHLGGVRAEPFGFEESLIWDGGGRHWDTGKYYPAEGPPVQPKGYDATLMTNQALTYMEAHRNEPFFLMLSWVPPHANFEDAPDSKKALYPKGSLPRRPNVPPETDENAGDVIWEKNGWESYQGYHAHISAVDDELGRILSKLGELGIEDRTIVVYSSDHGSMMGSHGVGSKRQPYEESIRVPFLVRCPGYVPQGRKVDALFGTVDVAPTLCGLAGVPIPDSFEGKDYSSWVFRGEGPDPDSQFIMHIAKDHASGGQKHPAPIFRGVRTRSHTYAVFPEGGGLLFDNEKDPYQRQNLFDKPEMKVLQQKLHGMLKDWLTRTGDSFALPEPKGES